MKYLKYIAIILIGNVIISCSDFLEPEPSSSITTDNYYTTAAELETGLMGVYAAIQGINSSDKDENHGVQWEFYVTEMRTDNTSTKSPDSEDASDAGQLESMDVLPTNNFVGNYYTSYFQVIYRANVILENIGVVEDADRALEIEAEAKFLRAFAYFNLVRLFGDLPLVDRVISPAETDIQFTRVETSLIYDLIVSDLKTAVSGLGDSYKTRASVNAAKGLLAKVYLSLETPDYVNAQLLCEEIINTNKYSLQSNYYNVFYSELNSEIIFAIGYNSSVQDNSQIFSAEWMNAVGHTSGVNYATTDVVAAIDTYGGTRIENTYRKDPLTVLSGGTIRYQVAKYFPDGASGGSDGQTFTGLPQLAGNDWIVLRYSDILLMRAEAILAGATETTSSSAIDSYMEVRKRAGFTAATDRPSKLTKEALLIERRVEFAFENQRLFDLIRFGAAQATLSAFATANNFTFTATDLLLPIPQNEINLSNGLMEQNPGYN